MEEIRPTCPRCKVINPIKNGQACQKQRWKCRGCGYEFTRLIPRGKPLSLIKKAVELGYTTNWSNRKIAVELGVSDKTVASWRRNYYFDQRFIPPKSEWWSTKSRQRSIALLKQTDAMLGTSFAEGLSPS